jgi:hypothetical protein
MAPALVLEYIIDDKDNFEWEYDDLFQVCSYFGDINFLDISGKNVILVYKNFFDAFSCKEYLLNTNNFQSIDKNNNIVIRWYTNADEYKFSSKTVDKIKQISTPTYPTSNYQNQSNYFNSSDNYCSSMNKTLNSYYAAWTLSPNTNYDFNNILSNQNYPQTYNNNINNNYPYVNYSSVNINNNFINNQNFFYNNNYTSYHPKFSQSKETNYKVFIFNSRKVMNSKTKNLMISFPAENTLVDTTFKSIMIRIFKFLEDLLVLRYYSTYEGM